MTQSPLEKLIVLAAASGLSAGEFRAALDAMNTAAPAELENLFKRVRNQLRHVDGMFLEFDRDVEQSSPAQRDILRLAKEAGLPPRLAAERITSAVLESDAAHALPPFNQKEGLKRWVDRVARIIGDSALLNAAVAAFASHNPDQRSWTLNRS